LRPDGRVVSGSTLTQGSRPGLNYAAPPELDCGSPLYRATKEVSPLYPRPSLRDRTGHSPTSALAACRDRDRLHGLVISQRIVMSELTLVCHECGHTIYIPRAKPPEKALRQLVFFPTHEPQGNFLCPHCSRVSFYTIEDFQIRLSETPVPLEPREHPVCVSVRTKCDTQSCTALVRVAVIVNVSADIKADALASITAARYYGAQCPNGHRQRGRPLAGAFAVARTRLVSRVVMCLSLIQYYS